MTKQLPANPNITHLKNQAKDLQRGVHAGDAEAVARVREFHPSPADDVSEFSLRDAQLTIAREYGFDGWHALNTEVGERMVEQRDLHRWFGVQLNNSIWDHLDTADIGPDSDRSARELMLYSAYASAYHWMNAGNEANHARGEHLIARTAIQVGMPDLALQHARRCLELCETHPDVVEDWDLGFALEAVARAEAANGDPAASATLARAEAVAAAVIGDQDREILEGELQKGPWFGVR